MLPHGLLQVNDRALFGRLPLLGRLFMTLMAICPICSKTIDSVCFEKEHLYKRTIPVWHSADNEDHHWSLDEQSSENVRRYFNNGQSAFSGSSFSFPSGDQMEFQISRHKFLELGL